MVPLSTTMLTRAQITTLRRAAGLLVDLGEDKLAEDIDRFVDLKTGRLDENGEIR